MPRVRLLVTVLCLAVALTGCFGASAPREGTFDESARDIADESAPGLRTPGIRAASTPANDSRSYPACAHPYPCGDGSEWPHDLEGPFSLRDLLEVRVPSHDGVELHAWIYLPDVPEGVGVPAVVWSHPYYSVNYDAGDSPEYWENAIDWGAGLDVRTLIENGYAFVAVSVRGTGESGGCFGMGGVDEQKDQAFFVEWLAAQPWSNGRVAMMGLSYHGTTPWMAAIESPAALKTIVVAGMVSDWYTFYHTPQGAAMLAGPPFQALFSGIMNGPPIYATGGPAERLEGYAAILAERACADLTYPTVNLAVGAATDVRDAAFWEPRRYVDRFGDVTAAVLLTHGFQDAWGSGHEQQESAAWETLTQAPKWQVQGQWGHVFPHELRAGDARLPEFGSHILTWLEFWLKGVGPLPDILGTVDYQDGDGTWHTSTAWPPVEARSEVVYLADGALAPRPGNQSAAFRSVPDPVGAQRSSAENRIPSPGALCPTLDPVAGLPTSLVYVSQPAESAVLLAGNPHAYLRITSDLSGGLVAVTLYDVAPDFACEDGVARGARPLSIGVADLRHHAGAYGGTPFPTGVPTHVRIDLVNFAETIPQGHRLAALVHHNDPAMRGGQLWHPTILVHADGGAAASHLVLPVVAGTLGGDAPSLPYPPRPFVPGS